MSILGALGLGWESWPWDLPADAAAEQRKGYDIRAAKAITWQAVPFNAFPQEGLFGHERDWFITNDIAFFSTMDGESLILVQNTWHGFPDPPEWGLASRPSNRNDVRWAQWGFFPNIPKKWYVPGES
ncbi:hypothetical protein [Nitrospirillum sp. BR 11163]|uniref:hypothetical protein n=1 Tax=Nitrospirillum sp. BR 11163 TaxID=3104323 RepID=UPI002AFF193F|nr:hypothetical protein [Nitrospirillum sp. BR 11163]MEA1675794.1 hypothetical protein [Nitrospirillum sp. BR 11163]